MTESEKHPYHKLETITLREYMEARLMALTLAIEKQEAATDARLDGMNEWRQTYGDLVNRAVSREVFDTWATEMERRVGNTESRLSNIDGRIIGISAGIGLVMLIITVIINFSGG